MPTKKQKIPCKTGDSKMSRLVTLEIGFTWETMQNFMEPILKKYKHTRIIAHIVDTTRTPLYYIKPEVLRCLD